MLKKSNALDSLTAALDRALKAQESADRAVAEAEDAMHRLDGLDVRERELAWQRFGEACAEAARAPDAVATLRGRCADTAAAEAAGEVADAEAEVREAETRIAALGDEFRQARAALIAAGEVLEDARRAAADARIAFLDPQGPEAEVYRTRERQDDELVSWAARSRGREQRVPRHLAERVLQRREQMEREARDEHEEWVAQARWDGTLVQTESVVTRLDQR
jgi:hypothetical protein